jgi:acetyl-CoA acetyltransferase
MDRRSGAHADRQVRGGLSAVRPDDLGAVALRGLIDATGVPPEAVEDVLFGCANQAGEDNRDVARMSLLLADFPVEVAGATVNRLCGRASTPSRRPPARSCSARPTATSGAAWSP